MAEFSSHGSLERMSFSFKVMQEDPHKTYAELDAALNRGFALTQGHVHVETTALKFSGSSSSNWGNNHWSGDISYGGQGVDYAGYEAQRGGDHDFLYPLVVTVVEMDGIIGRMLDGI